jgi:hypothetical protein
MAVTFEPKRRLRLPSGDLPEPKAVHSRSWLPYALVVWLLVVAAGHGVLYGWLPRLIGTAPPLTSAPPNSPMPAAGDFAQPIAPLQDLAPTVASTTATSPTRAIQPTSVDPDKLPACEAVAEAQSSGEYVDPLPVDLARSPFGSLLDTRLWTKPCRGAHPVRVHLCVVVKAGELLGATAATDPSDASTERCIIRAASRLKLESNSALRKVHLTIDLPSERSRQ